nr:ornithine carbamoyltransferase [bacterium]
RTRVSFEVGIHQLGAQPVALDAGAIAMGVRESIPDVARVLSRFLDAMMIRTFKQADLEQLVAYGSMHIINGLTDDYHPCQALADMLCIWENFGQFKGRRLCYVGDGNNVAHSLMLACAKVGMDITVATPKGDEPDRRVLAWAQEAAQQTGATVLVTDDPESAVAGADAVYTDVWASMGMEAEREERAKRFAPYRVTQKLMSLAAPHAIFLHCLPAHRGEEVEAAVIDGPQSRVFDQAENRLHAQKGVMALTIGGPGALS